MKHKFTLACCALITAAFSPVTTHAQFFKFLPAESNYLNADVRSELSGLTYSYRLQDDSTLALKTIIVRTDNSGQVQWTKQAGPNFTSYTLAPDTSVILTGGATVTGGNRIALLQKQDQNGNVVWAKSLKISSADVGIGNIMVAADNTIFATLTRSSFSSSTYYSRAAVAAYDGSGNMLWTKYFSNSAFTSEYGFTRTLLAANGDFIGVADVRGSSGASANGMMVTRISPQGTVRFSKYIDFKDTHSQLSVTGLVETASGDLVLGGRLMTDQISTYTNTMWMGKMDSAGNLGVQKVYSGGNRVGEQLHSLRYDGGKLYAYLHFYSPYDSVVAQSVWIGTVNEQTLAFTAHNATEIAVNPEDPYGNVSNSFCITSDGKPTVAAGFYCVETDLYYPLMQQWPASLASSCAALDAVQPLTDSTVAYVATAYTPSGSSFTVTYASDTTVISLTPIAPVVTAGLCSGCANPTGVTQVVQKEMFRIYPNPGDGRFFLELEGSLGEAQIAISNIMGATVYQSGLQGNRQSIDLTEQPAGLYFVSVRTNNGRVITSKVVKDR